MSGILGLIKQHGPMTVSQLMVMSGLDDKAVRNAIDKLRLEHQPICHSSRGFWHNPGFVPSGIPHRQWKAEP
jgi:hypothetical protein